MSSGQVAAWLAAHRPAEVDRLAVSSVQRCGVELDMHPEVRFPSDGHCYDVLRIDQVRGEPEARAAALAEVRRLMTPAHVDELELWLAELSVIVARRADDDATELLRLNAYTSRLADYPADVVREALLKRTWKFWPSWAELKEACDRLVSPRRSIIVAIEAEVWREEQRAIEDERRRRERAEREAADAKQAAKAAACRSNDGCPDCFMPDLCERVRRRRAEARDA